MSQRSEKYMRRMEEHLVNTTCAVGSLRGDVRDMEELLWTLLKEQVRTRKKNEQLLSAVNESRREQRRKELSRERITILLCATVLWCLLVWIALEIFKMV